jgi:glycosyltransferase involved in cell wall biosynthesis
MRVLMVLGHFYSLGPIGGTGRQLHKLAKALVARGVAVQIVTGQWTRKEPRTETFDGMPVHRVFTFWNMGDIRGLRKFGTYTYMLALLVYLIRHRKVYDIIHVHSMSHNAFVGTLAAKILGKKVMVKVMASGEWSDLKRMRDNSFVWGTRYMLPFISRHCDCAVALNRETIKELREAGFEPERIALVPNGVVVGNGRKLTYQLHKPPQLVFVGRLQRQKGLDVLLLALTRMEKVQPTADWRLNILGDGPHRAEYESQAYQLGIGDRISFKGQVKDVPAELIDADIFVLPSRAEGMSNALLEAMAAAVPSIATRISGNTSLIQDGINGLLVPSENPEALANAITSLLDSQPLRERLAQGAIDTIHQHFSINSVADHYTDLYRHLLA